MAAKKTFLLRVDPAMWDQLEAWAADEFRSVNGQVEYVLKEALQQRRGWHRGAEQAEPPQRPPAPQGTPT
ncbi:MAG: Arc family DNA-binding protein [Planctomycetota bacterium]|nr:Arc family DNA-binding protein [Planctomycetota bacterium]